MDSTTAILFDLDETLIDSQRGAAFGNMAVSGELARILAGKGLQVDPVLMQRRMHDLDEGNLKKVGRFLPKAQVIKQVLDENAPGYELGAEEVQRLIQLFWKEFALNSPPYPYTIPTLEYLVGRGYLLGLVSDTDGLPGIKHWRISILPFNSFFGAAIVAGEDLPYTKPDVRPYMAAASQLGVAPESCVFVGDRPLTDIVGAKRAGMRAVLVRRRKWDYEGEPDFVIRELSELRSLL